MKLGEESTYRLMIASAVWPRAIFLEETAKLSSGRDRAFELFALAVLVFILVFGAYQIMCP